MRHCRRGIERKVKVEKTTSLGRGQNQQVGISGLIVSVAERRSLFRRLADVHLTE